MQQNKKESTGPKVRVITLVTFIVVFLTAIGLCSRYPIHQELGAMYVMFSLFFATNMLICYWEISLFLKRSLVEERTTFWQQQRLSTGRAAHNEFFTSKIPWASALSPSVWADVWATYAQYDPSFADRRTFGFNVDIGNGFVTLIPTVVLYVAFTTEFFAPRLVGILGIALFWQWTYMTGVYLSSFFVAGRHKHLTNRELTLYILGANSPWLIFPILGLYVCVCLIVDDSYGILS